jgi:hypothetical protein
MTDDGTQWIEVIGWDRFQHYRDRGPLWIKTYVRLLDDDAYLSLTQHRALLLHRLWLQYAISDRTLRDDTRNLSRRCAMKVTRSDLDALCDAGFIRVAASKPLAKPEQGASVSRARATETEKETEDPLTPTQSAGDLNTTCQQCGEQITAGASCWSCGAPPRAAGSNPRAVNGLRREQSRANLYALAQQLVADRWHGISSLEFDDLLDNLERDQHAQLSPSERTQLWDAARAAR